MYFYTKGPELTRPTDEEYTDAGMRLRPLLRKVNEPIERFEDMDPYIRVARDLWTVATGKDQGVVMDLGGNVEPDDVRSMNIWTISDGKNGRLPLAIGTDGTYLLTTTTPFAGRRCGRKTTWDLKLPFDADLSMTIDDPGNFYATRHHGLQREQKDTYYPFDIENGYQPIAYRYYAQGIRAIIQAALGPQRGRE